MIPYLFRAKHALEKRIRPELAVMSILWTTTLLAQVLALGGAIHIALISKQRGWWFLASGIALITARRLLSNDSESGPYLVALHALAMLIGITMIYRSHKKIVDDLTSLADCVPNMVSITNEKGEVVFVNKRWSEYSGITAEDLHGEKWKRFIHPEDVEHAATMWCESLASGRQLELDIRIKSAKGKFRWFLARSFPIRCTDGRIVKWYSSLTDIHELKEGTLWLERKSVEARANKETTST